MSEYNFFTEQMAAFAGAEDPQRAIDEGYYVDFKGSLSKTIEEKICTFPVSSHALVGEVGSGKTTQLLVARDRLREIEILEPYYLDITQHLDIHWIRPGNLINLIRSLPPSPSDKQRVFLLDGLDRIDDSKKLSNVIKVDINGIKQGEKSSVIFSVASTAFAFYLSPLVDFVSSQPDVYDPDTYDFLKEVILSRASKGFIENSAINFLVTFSGGILRTLINLTQTSIEEAYISGDNQVRADHVSRLLAPLFAFGDTTKSNQR